MSSWFTAHRSLVATVTSGTVVAALVATLAIVSSGYTAQRMDLTDPSVWVVNGERAGDRTRQHRGARTRQRRRDGRRGRRRSCSRGAPCCSSTRRARPWTAGPGELDARRRRRPAARSSRRCFSRATASSCSRRPPARCGWCRSRDLASFDAAAPAMLTSGRRRDRRARRRRVRCSPTCRKRQRCGVSSPPNSSLAPAGRSIRDRTPTRTTPSSSRPRARTGPCSTWPRGSSRPRRGPVARRRARVEPAPAAAGAGERPGAHRRRRRADRGGARRRRPDRADRGRGGSARAAGRRRRLPLRRLERGERLARVLIRGSGGTRSAADAGGTRPQLRGERRQGRPERRDERGQLGRAVRGRADRQLG